ncbi:Protein prenylyltransferase [Venustampulla echinocandica]|uniref:Geranylgeranyl transferase type-2 subunit alpha n=1 Tax=Venustampulla echinocandica TaxID=2656787 RepID=A0A370TXF6_9HELO|nr:Protein prenylyltransferase [Venustampulla echinocandica]RDL40202.1 Protein prenylyltransferase [Venustampulla echinocandica]
MASHGIPRPATTAHRTEQQLQEEQLQIQEYRDLEDLIRTKIAERQYTLEVLQLTSKLLKKNPEYYTIWNDRRRLLIYGLFSESSDSSSSSKEPSSSSPTVTTSTSSEGVSSSAVSTAENLTTTLHDPPSRNRGKSGTILDLIKGELEFLFPIMIKFPKCYWLWNYRLWILQQANERLDPDIARDLWNRELILVGKMLVKDSRNFHGWGYRRMVVTQLESQELHGKSMVESEFEYTTKVIHGLNGLSNFSAWHRRSKLIPTLLDQRGADDATRQQFLEDEFDLIISAMYTDSYPYAQSAWFYYQFLMTTVTDYVGHATITPNWTQEDRVVFVTRQLAVLGDMLDGAEDCKWVYDALIEYTLALCQMEEREPLPDEKTDCQSWLMELRKLDHLRSGRWDDLEISLEKR